MSTELWTLAELADRVAGALSSGYGGQQSRRVTEVPDTRAIRYYTTLGLVDRPAAMRGRTALYGERHLWQLVAIKRLQADGRSLAEVQLELAGAPDGALRRLAAIPAESFWRRVPARSTADRLTTARSTTAPAATGGEPAMPDGAGPAEAPATGAPAAPSDEAGFDRAGLHEAEFDQAEFDDDSPEDDRSGYAPRPRATHRLGAGPTVYQAVPLDGGAVVLVPRRDTFTDTEIAALRAAAGPLDAAVARLTNGH